MTDLTPTVNELLVLYGSRPVPNDPNQLLKFHAVDGFLKEAQRINSHISSLLSYLKSIRPLYLSAAPTRAITARNANNTTRLSSRTTSDSASTNLSLSTRLTDQDRDSIDSSTAALLRDLSSSIANLASAENVRQETEAAVLRNRFPRLNSRLLRWTGGSNVLELPRSPEQLELEDKENTLKTVRESVLWFLRRGLEAVAEFQRQMVEKRVERAREKEKNILYKSQPQQPISTALHNSTMIPNISGQGDTGSDLTSFRGRDALSLDQNETAEIVSQLSPEQLQLFAQENNNLFKYYEDTLGKVQNAEKSLLEISSLQQTLVGHLAVQEEYVNLLVADATTTQANVGRGNKELKKAAERRSTAQMVFWCTVGLCSTLIIWDAIF
ncbi:hypothetical protein FQN57_001598 [Myotisia sp. PD_48]|nr:hypothetical protein FQN57_001598 [Myotisia sp. PD_48]